MAKGSRIDDRRGLYKSVDVVSLFQLYAYLFIYLMANLHLLIYWLYI